MARPRPARRPHAAARAGAPLQPPPRHRRDLRRRRLRARRDGVRRAQGPRAADQRAARRPPLPVRHGRRRRRRARPRRRGGGRRPRRAARAARRRRGRLARARVRRLAAGAPRRRRRARPRRRAAARRSRARRRGPPACRSTLAATARASGTAARSRPAAPREPTGDVAARLELRATELEATFELLDELLARPLAAGTTTTRPGPRPLGVGRVESPRGATLAAVELADGRIARLHLRTGSYANWPALAHAAAGNLLPDFPLINKSFELCYACVDR